MTTAFYLFSNIFHIYGVFLFSKISNRKHNVNKLLEFCLYIAYYILNSLCFLLFHNPIINLVSNAIPFFIITLFDRKSDKNQLWDKLLLTFAMIVVTVVCDLFVSGINILLHTDSIFFSQGFVANILFISLTGFAVQKMKAKNEKYVNLPAMYYLTMIFVPLVSIFLGYYTYLTLDYASLIVSVLLMLINIDIYYLYDKLLDTFYEKNINDLVRQQNQAYLNQLNLIQKTQLNIRCLNHDMNNHILRMQNYLEDEKYDDLKEYLSNIKEYVTVQEKISDSGNDEVDSLLNFKLRVLKSMNVDYKIRLSIPEHIDISSFDMSIIIGNLIDNSLEALNRIDDNRKLSVEIIYSKGYLKMKITNTFDGIVLDNYKTRKTDAENHGMGLISVRQIVEKYNGLMEMEVNGNQFTAMVIMYEK